MHFRVQECCQRGMNGWYPMRETVRQGGIEGRRIEEGPRSPIHGFPRYNGRENTQIHRILLLT